MPTRTVIAILCSDLHLSIDPPVARSAEPDWLAAQARPLKQLRKFANYHDVPIICAGDVFHYWKSPPELINFALQHLPPMYAVPGQHDLPLHNYADMDKSAFGTLVRTGLIKLLEPGQPKMLSKGWWMHGFPWGHDVDPPYDPVSDGKKHLAVIHAYIWQKQSGFPGAKVEDRVPQWRPKLEGYKVALFGDNHKPFLNDTGPCTIFNHGGFQRRAIDEYDHQPALGMLMSDGTVTLHSLECSQDLWMDPVKQRMAVADSDTMRAFLQELNTLGGDGELEFQQAVEHYMQTYNVSAGAKQIILQTLTDAPLS